jgi:two-component system sensor histidine kinase UhpB
MPPIDDRAPRRRAGLSPQSPWSDSRFWLLLLVVLAFALVRLAVTVGLHLEPGSVGIEFSTLVIFVVPVVVAALDYGLAGGLATATWVAALAIPRLFEASGRRTSTALWAEALQLLLLVGLALLVGHRVSSEERSREEADALLAARLHAEALYQDIFESNRSPILIADADGLVVQANPSADRVFRGGGMVGCGSRRLVDVVGVEASALLLTKLLSYDANAPGPFDSPGHDLQGPDPDPGPDGRVPPMAFEVNGESLLYRPTATLVGPLGRNRRMQVIFEDVTAETRRHDLMEAYANQVVLGQEEERRHIAQELHDGPLQTLIHLCRQIDVLDAQSDALAGPGRPLASMRGTVEQTVAELRSIARGLRPSILDDFGLVASLNQVVTEATGRQELAGRFEVSGTERRLPPHVELAIFRIAQEAVTNVEHHAAADHFVVTLDFGGYGVRLEVADDGIGFDRRPEREGSDGHSLGLPGMHERARLVGGRLIVRSTPGYGTTVEARVPVAVSTRA